MTFKSGSLVVLPADEKQTEILRGIGDDSIVCVAGLLEQHRWQTGGGTPRDTFQIRAQQITVLYDARKGRLT